MAFALHNYYYQSFYKLKIKLFSIQTIFVQGTIWREDEINGLVLESSIGLGKISEQKGILGPGPAELRYPEAI